MDIVKGGENCIFDEIYNIFIKAFKMKETSYIRMRSDIRKFISTKYRLNMDEMSKCEFCVEIKNMSVPIHLHIIFLNREQTKLMGFAPGNCKYEFKALENFVGSHGNELILYIPEYFMFVNEQEYPLTERFYDLSCIIHELVRMYCITNMTYRTYAFLRDAASVAITTHLLVDLNVCNSEGLPEEITINGVRYFPRAIAEESIDKLLIYQKMEDSKYKERLK